MPSPSFPHKFVGLQHANTVISELTLPRNLFSDFAHFGMPLRNWPLSCASILLNYYFCLLYHLSQQQCNPSIPTISENLPQSSPLSSWYWRHWRPVNPLWPWSFGGNSMKSSIQKCRVPFTCVIARTRNYISQCPIAILASHFALNFVVDIVIPATQRILVLLCRQWLSEIFQWEVWHASILAICDTLLFTRVIHGWWHVTSRMNSMPASTLNQFENSKKFKIRKWREKVFWHAGTPFC